LCCCCCWSCCYFVVVVAVGRHSGRPMSLQTRAFVCPPRLHKDFVPATFPRRYAPAAVIPSTIEHGTPFFRNPTATSTEKYRQCLRCSVRALVWRNADRLPNHCPRILQHVRSETHQSQNSATAVPCSRHLTTATCLWLNLTPNIGYLSSSAATAVLVTWLEPCSTQFAAPDLSSTCTCPIRRIRGTAGVLIRPPSPQFLCPGQQSETNQRGALQPRIWSTARHLPAVELLRG
jgi:hypothetical protein